MNIQTVIGIDIGGTYTKIGLVDKEGNLYYENVIKTDAYENPENFVNALHKLLHKDILNLEKYDIKGIGIGAPNGNFYSGTIEHAPNLPWKGIVPLADLMKTKFSLPVILTNDANAAAQGEMIFGAAKDLKNFLMITLGTGLGSGLVVNGGLVYGHDGFAGELGHICAKEKGRQCGCGRKGCLETYVSATGIKRTVFSFLASESDDSVFRNMTFNQVEAKDISEAANNGDPLAIKAYEKTGRLLGKSLADTVAHISPEKIFLFGGLAKAGKWIFEPTKKYMESYLLPIYKNKIEILPSALLDKNIAVLGAAALIWNDLEN